jgi:hypothetical protein
MNKKTRLQRRHAKMVVKENNVKKVYNVVEFIRKRSADLPKMKDKNTGLSIDHEKNLIMAYRIDGIAGINFYVQSIKAVVQKEAGRNVISRLAGAVLVKWYQFVQPNNAR